MHRIVVLSLPLIVAAVPVRANEDVAALIRRHSQEFSDASASGDAKALARLLDERVLFMNEGGEMPSKKEIVDGAQPPPPGTSNTLVQKDFKVEVHGNVAVTSFTDVATVQFHGQKHQAEFLSTEVWLKETGGWKLISSQTMAAQQDPPAVSLPSATLDEYVGIYRAGDDFTYRIERNGDELTAIAQGSSKPIVLKAELRDVLFTPGQPRTRRIFQRDANGKVTGFVSRREGRDWVLRRVTE
jgi:ketosteroid isomerase-like protein